MTAVRTSAAVAGLLAVAAIAPAMAGGKTVGECPGGRGAEWTLVGVEELGLDPETLDGIPSLDGNGDGLTCVRAPQLAPSVEPFTIFRDNTV